MIYLASPYTDPDHAVMEQRFDAVCRKAGELMNRGEVVYSPIAHCHPIAVRVGLPRDWTFWEKFDREMLRSATDFYVLRLPGWEASKGITGERQIAEAMGLRTVFIDP
jgi:hypothetical protein